MILDYYKNGAVSSLAKGRRRIFYLPEVWYLRYEKHKKETTLTIKVNERSKGGKAFLQLVDFFNSNEKKVMEVMEEKSPYSPEFVAKIRRTEKH